MKNRSLAIFTTLLSMFTCFGFLPPMQAAPDAVPAPDGCYTRFTTAEGCNALKSLTSGAGNTGLGWGSLTSDTTGSYNTAVGAGTLLLNTGDSNTAVGAVALLSNTIGIQNTAVGTDAMAYNTYGHHNTAVGAFALQNNTGGYENMANGSLALYSNTLGQDNVANGAFALQLNTVGNYNVAIGVGALRSCTGSGNTAIGNAAGYNLTTGTGNVYIGTNVVGVAGEENTTRIRNIGSTPIVGGTIVVVAGTGDIGDQRLGYASSSRRYKEEIKPMAKASETLFALKPVTFRAKGNMDPTHVKHYGLIAEDVAAVDPDLVVYNPEGKPETLRFDSINAMLLNEFLKEHRRVQELEANAAHQQKQIEALTAGLQKVSAQLEMSRPAPQTVLNSQ